MAPKPREVLDLANDIVKAEEALAALKTKWNALFAGNTESIKPSVGRPPRDNSTASQVLAFINSNSQYPYDAGSVSRRLNLDREAVASALYNLFVAKKIDRASRGFYQAKSSNGVESTMSTEEE